MLSDVDLWISYEDKALQAAVLLRNVRYSQVGDVLNVWETPRFAPLGGHHSIVLYNTPTGPIEVDFCHAPLSNSFMVNGQFEVLTGPGLDRGEVQWAKAGDLLCAEERLCYLLTMCYVGIRYAARGQTHVTSWLTERYNQARDLYWPQLRILKAGPADPYLTIRSILARLSIIGEGHRRAIRAIRNFTFTVEALHPFTPA
jgi:hypothetical protein